MDNTRQGWRVGRRIAALAGVLAIAGTTLIASPASAEDDPLMQHVRCTSADYPDVDFPDVPYLMACVELRLTSGEATFGSLSTTIDQLIQVRQALLLETVIGENGPEVVITPLPEPGGGGASLPTIEVPGGLLAGTGLEALAPLTAPVTGVSATLLTAGPMSASNFNFGALFTGNGVLATANLPIGVQVNNLLLGTECTVGNLQNPIDLGMDLTLNGQIGTAPDPDGGLNTALFNLSMGDPAFAIPGAAGCGLLVGPLLDGAGLGALNVFNTAVNGAAGTPSPESNNHLSFDGVLGLALGE